MSLSEIPEVHRLRDTVEDLEATILNGCYGGYEQHFVDLAPTIGAYRRLRLAREQWTALYEEHCYADPDHRFSVPAAIGAEIQRICRGALAPRSAP